MLDKELEEYFMTLADEEEKKELTEDNGYRTKRSNTQDCRKVFNFNIYS